MSLNIANTAEDLFEKIRSRFEKISIGDEKAKTTQDPALARFFNFDFVSKDGTNFGNIHVSLIDEKSLKIYFSKTITEKLNELQKNEWYDFLRSLRMFAKRHMLAFDTRDITRSNLDIKDVKQQAAADSPFQKNDVSESVKFVKGGPAAPGNSYDDPATRPKLYGKKTCSKCSGVGFSKGVKCLPCKGTGKVQTETTESFEIQTKNPHKKGTLKHTIWQKNRERDLKDFAKDPHGNKKDADEKVAGPSGTSTLRKTNEGAILDSEAAIKRHDQRKIDHEKQYGPMNGQDLYSHENVRKQLLAKRKRAQAAYAKKMDESDSDEYWDADVNSEAERIGRKATKDRLSKMSQAEKVKQGWAHPNTLSKSTDTDDGRNYSGQIGNCRWNESVDTITRTPPTHTIEAYGIKGMDRKQWRKSFKDYNQLADWCEKFDAEVYGTRDLEAAKKGNLSPAVPTNEQAKWRSDDLEGKTWDWDDENKIQTGRSKDDALAGRQSASDSQSGKDPLSLAGKFGSKYAKKHGVGTKKLMKNLPLESTELDEGWKEKAAGIAAAGAIGVGALAGGNYVNTQYKVEQTYNQKIEQTIKSVHPDMLASYLEVKAAAKKLHAYPRVRYNPTTKSAETYIAYEPDPKAVRKFRELRDKIIAQYNIEKPMQVESKIYGLNRKQSAQDVARKNARIIIKHSKPVMDEVRGARSRAIESIFIENTSGERFKVPSNSLSEARALARHVAEGGNIYDDFGKHIIEMCKENTALREFMRGTRGKEFVDETADEIVGSAAKHYLHTQNLINSLKGRRGYSQYKATWESRGPQPDSSEEFDPNELRHRFRQERVDPRIDRTVETAYKVYQRHIGDSVPNEINEFESHLNSIAEDSWKLPEQDKDFEELADLFREPLMVGVDAMNATGAFYQLLGDDDLSKMLSDMAEKDPEQDCRQAVIYWLKKHNPKVHKQLAMKLSKPEESEEQLAADQAAAPPAQNPNQQAAPAQPPAQQQPAADPNQQSQQPPGR
jgi:hypothetical protein